MQANLRSDVQESHKATAGWIRLLDKLKSHSCTESCRVHVADIWRERVRSYLGRSHGHSRIRLYLLGCAVVEIRFAVRSQQRP
nr:MAG TPA: hypothetical protein [Caudoviricetes sp.]